MDTKQSLDFLDDFDFDMVPSGIGLRSHSPTEYYPSSCRLGLSYIAAVHESICTFYVCKGLHDV
jgi:hypothetical protein